MNLENDNFALFCALPKLTVCQVTRKVLLDDAER